MNIFIVLIVVNLNPLHSNTFNLVAVNRYPWQISSSEPTNIDPARGLNCILWLSQSGIMLEFKNHKSRMSGE